VGGLLSIYRGDPEIRRVIKLTSLASANAAAPAGVHATARLLDMATDLLATVDGNGCFTRLNPAWEDILGWSLKELVGRPVMELIHPDDVERTLALGGWANGEVNRFENRYLCKDGSWRSLVWTAHKDGDVWYAAARDVTERETLERHALHDSLTGLPNRLLFRDRTQLALARLERKHSPLALL
jgi:PAS domain S-box-containing protein